MRDDMRVAHILAFIGMVVGIGGACALVITMAALALGLPVFGRDDLGWYEVFGLAGVALSYMLLYVVSRGRIEAAGESKTEEEG